MKMTVSVLTCILWWMTSDSMEEEQRTGVKCWTINLEKREDRLTMRFATDNMTGTLLTAWLKLRLEERNCKSSLPSLLSNTSSTLSLTGHPGCCCCSCAASTRHASDSRIKSKTQGRPVTSEDFSLFCPDTKHEEEEEKKKGRSKRRREEVKQEEEVKERHWCPSACFALTSLSSLTNNLSITRKGQSSTHSTWVLQLTNFKLHSLENVVFFFHRRRKRKKAVTGKVSWSEICWLQAIYSCPSFCSSFFSFCLYLLNAWTNFAQMLNH